MNRLQTYLYKKESIMTDYAIISLRGDKRLAVYRVDPTTAEFTHLQDVDCGAATGALVYDARRQTVYGPVKEPAEMRAWRFDPASGTLSERQRLPITGGACFIGQDRARGYLMSAYYHEGKIMIHPLAADGSIRAAVEDRQTAANAHSIQADPSNHFVFVPHIAGPNLIAQFRFDALTGRLTPNDPPTATPAEGDGPRHFVWHPILPIVYFVNEQGGSVTAYDFDAATGTLSRGDSVSTLPADFSGENTCAEIRITQDARHIYATNRGHDSLAWIEIAPDGGLGLCHRVATEAHPRAMTLDADETHVYVLGMQSNTLAVYSRDRASGGLVPLRTQPIGDTPIWIEYIRA